MKLLLLIAFLQAFVSHAAPASTVEGSVVYPAGEHLSSAARLEVRVEDVSLADAPARTICTTTASPVGPAPVQFAIDCPDEAITSSHRYVVRAQIWDGDALLYTSTRAYPVLDGAGVATSPIVMVERVSGSRRSPARTLTDTYWKLVLLADDPAIMQGTGREPHMVLRSAGLTVGGSSGCNSFSGVYEIDGTNLKFARMLSTMRACLDGMEQEQRFLTALPRVRSFRIAADELTLLDQSAAVVAVFFAVDLR